MVSSAKGVTFRAFQRRIASFRVAGVALRDFPTCFHDVSQIILCGRHNTLATFSEDVLHFSWKAQHFGDLRCFFHGTRTTLDVSSCVFFAHRVVRAGQSGDKVQNSVAGVAFCDR